MDRYYKYFIEIILNNVRLPDLSDYAELYYSNDKNADVCANMKKSEENMRKIISDAFIKDKLYKEINSKEFVRTLLLDYLTEDEEKNTVLEFCNFTTYFSGFWLNRKNMFSADEKSTAISYRCINENLPKFLDNLKSFSKIKNSLSINVMNNIEDNCNGLYNTTVNDVFSLDYFNFVLSQSGIDRYNQIISGYTLTNGNKVQGINEYVNLYNQQVAKSDNRKRLPLLKLLYKQILSDRESVSFIPESFNDDNELLKSVNIFYNGDDNIASLSDTLDKLFVLFNHFNEYNHSGIYIINDLSISNISNDVFGSWNIISDNWKTEYENKHSDVKRNEKFYEKEKSEYKNISSFFIDELQNLGKCDDRSIIVYLSNTVCQSINNIKELYNSVKLLLINEYPNTKKLSNDDENIDKIKSFLDEIKTLEKFLKPLLGKGNENNKDNLFYGEFLPLFDNIKSIDLLYNKVRNYITKKPYSNDKIKLNFNCSHFLSEWAQNFNTKSAVLFYENDKYYIGIIDKKLKSEQRDKLYSDIAQSSFFHVIYDSQKPDKKNTPRLFIRSKGDNYSPAVKKYNLPIEDIINLYDNKYYTVEYRKQNEELYEKSLIKLIDYFKIGFMKHESYCKYSFNWKKSDEYSNIKEFYEDTINSCYNIFFEKINKNYLLKLVDEGQVYLFQFYNKDFSDFSKGNPNLHTMYFKMLFDERNIADVVYKLNGQCEMFYRKASISENDKIIHKANQPINNKNTNNKKKTSLFTYDLIKDKRFTDYQFSIHIPITMNFKANGTGFINNIVKGEIKISKDNYVIGIDRGERNLIYIVVIDNNGKIVEQKSLNEIVGDNGYKVNYHTLLDNREKDRDNARKDWKTIGNIKELKEGYLSQVIHEICKLIIKYDAVVVMEDLNSGFMNSRKKVDKQVYQKFEKMMTDKLNYLVDKNADVYVPGGLLNAYQLTNKADKPRDDNQDGLIFYIPAWLTSKIDPTTGFVNLFRLKNIKDKKQFFELFDNILYNENSDMFEFTFNYEKKEFLGTDADFRKIWTVCSNGERIETFRNKEKNNQWNNRTVILTDEFKKLFEKYDINYNLNLKEQIDKQTSNRFFSELFRLFSLMLQMRNSETGNVDVDYLISPVRNSNGEFYDSRKVVNHELPENADANGAYNIARKGLWAIKRIKEAEDVTKVKLSISKKEWLEFAQSI